MIYKSIRISNWNTIYVSRPNGKQIRISDHEIKKKRRRGGVARSIVLSKREMDELTNNIYKLIKKTIDRTSL